MYEGKKRLYLGILGFLMFVFFSSCITTRPDVIPSTGDGAFETGSIIAEAGSGQTELAITGERIENASGNLESAIANGTGDIREIIEILQRIRERPIEGIK